MRWLKTDRGIAALVAVFSVLVALAIVLAFAALSKTADLANPTDKQVVERLQRGVDVMTREQARDIIGQMLKKSGRSK